VGHSQPEMRQVTRSLVVEALLPHPRLFNISVAVIDPKDVAVLQNTCRSTSGRGNAGFVKLLFGLNRFHDYNACLAMF